MIQTKVLAENLTVKVKGMKIVEFPNSVDQDEVAHNELPSARSTPELQIRGGIEDGWMNDLRFYILFNSVSVISGRWEVDNERLCAMELHLWLRRFRPRARIELSPVDQ